MFATYASIIPPVISAILTTILSSLVDCLAFTLYDILLTCLVLCHIFKELQAHRYHSLYIFLREGKCYGPIFECCFIN